MAAVSRIVAALVFMLMAVASVHGTDDASAPSSADTCGQVLTSLLPCVPAIGKDAQKPTPECCSAIKAVSPTCVCYLISSKPDIPDPLKDINLDAVAKLPKACGLKAHYVSH
ncbi:protein MpLTPG4 [Marchantia polymorpha subsp. ruderalis]|nr:hypothetical protein MARPO_0033s0039 [Marchantia polymorpha]BBM98784.1 hypothetical protein Mp_1g16210 [Marchantia polymorpha subsp. ruderalis]|eukprot:PTQ41619.1 hypothetical protein MARPO_0033s0039 [Marchantia polymorpha]